MLINRFALAGAIACTALGSALAQTSSSVPGANPSNTTTIERSAPEPAEKPPLAGANSFTEAQARDRIEKAGFSQVKILKKDEQGIWRATASRGGQQVAIALDYKGNVVAGQ